MTVVGGILCNQDDFLYALIPKTLHLSLNILNGTASVLATNHWYGTKCTGVVASLRNFYIGGVGWSCDNTRHSGVINFFIFPSNNHTVATKSLLYSLHDTVPGASSDDGIRLRKLVQKPLLVALAKASGNNEGLALAHALLLVLSHVQNSGNGLFLCGLYKSTGIDNENFSIRGIRCKLYAVVSKDTQHNLCVNKVFRASKADESCFQNIFLLI